MKTTEFFQHRITFGVLTLAIVLGVVIGYYELVRRGQWEAAARTNISREATKEAEAAFKAKEKELIDRLLDLEEKAHRQKAQYEISLQNHRRETARLRSEIERIREEGRQNEELFARLHGYALYERILSRTDELWNRYGLGTEDH